MPTVRSIEQIVRKFSHVTRPRQRAPLPAVSLVGSSSVVAHNAFEVGPLQVYGQYGQGAGCTLRSVGETRSRRKYGSAVRIVGFSFFLKAAPDLISLL